jgi:HEAT repeat protein
MRAPMIDLSLPLPLAIILLVGCVALAMVFVRGHRRRRRRRLLGKVRTLGRGMSDLLAGRENAAEVMRSANAASGGAFWTALEGFSLRLTRGEWLRLSRALDGVRHAARERRALRDDSPWRRALAARRLALLASKRSRQALRRSLARGPELVSLAAALTLGRYRDRRALRWLLNHPNVLAHRPPASLVAVLRAFGRPGLPLLVTALEQDLQGSALERAAVETLGLAAWRPGRAAIERRLAAGDPELRLAAARALGRLGAIECASSLMAALRDESWQVRAQAARALGRVQAPLAIPSLTRRLSDSAWWVRRHAAYSLAAMGEDGRQALREVADTSADPYARDMAREALDGGLAA